MNQMKNHGTINVRLDMDALYDLVTNLTSIWSGKILHDLTVCSQPWAGVSGRCLRTRSVWGTHTVRAVGVPFEEVPLCHKL